jgi:hypothetical protein
MRKIFFTILICVLGKTHAQTNEFTVTIDTIEFCANGYLSKVALFRDNFYCILESEQKNTTQSFKKMIVVSKKGEFIEDVFVPEEIQNMPHYEINIENDSLFVKETQFEKINLVLGEYVARFELTKTRDFKIFQDSSYDVYATCNGEWGGTIFFENRKTKEVYEASSTCPIVVNKISNEYYITNYMGHAMGFSSVLKISNPATLQKSKLNLNAEQGSNFHKGIEVLFDTANFFVPTSFELGDNLFHIYSDNIGTYIGIIEKSRMKSIYKFDFKFFPHYNQQLENGQQVLNCYLPDTKRNAILIIDKNNFNFYVFK